MTREQFRGVGVRVSVFCVLLLLSNASADSGNGSLASPPTRQSEVSGFDPTFQPSMAVIVIVLISAFFFIAFFSIYIRQCANDPQSVRRPSIVRLGFSWRTPRGLETAVIESFPTFVYSTVKALKIGKGSLECAVCLSEFEDDETLRLLPPCSHAFHPECIDAWLASHVTCPVCRADLREDPGEFAAENVAIDVPPDEADRPGNEEHQGDSEVATPRNDLSIPVTDDLSTPIPNVTANYPPTKTLRFMAPDIRQTKRPLKSIRKFSRSHSTGHSLMPPETHERFTLRLPENVRRQLIASGRMNRVASCSVFPVDAEGSSRGGHRVGEGSSRGGRSLRRARDDSTRSDGWTFSIAPPFIYRSFSSSTHGRDNSEPTEPEPPSPKPPLSPKSSTSTSQPTPILRTPLDCLVSRPDPADRSPTSMPAKIQA